MPIRTHTWALLLERLSLRETLDALKGYSYPSPAREVLCQQHGLTERELADVLKLHKSLYQLQHKGGPRGRPPGPAGPHLRDGLDLLLDKDKLRTELARLPLDQLLNASRLRGLQVRYQLRPVELSRVLDAHAEMLIRP